MSDEALPADDYNAALEAVRESIRKFAGCSEEERDHWQRDIDDLDGARAALSGR